MHNYRDLRENFKYIKERLRLRGVEEGFLEEVKEVNERLLVVERRIVEINTEKNKLIKEDSLGNKERIRELKEELNVLAKEEQEVSEKAQFLLLNIPNIPHESLTDKGELVREWGVKRNPSYRLLSHQELAVKNNLFDLEAGATVSGSGYVVYKDEGVRIYRALIDFTIKENTKKGYCERYLPVIVNKETLLGTAQLPKFELDLFKVGDGKYLSPTSETQLVNLYRNKIISSKDLPIKLTANTNCFRKEAGASGVDTAGVIRLHQFNKTEIVVVCKPEDSFNWLEQMVKDACDILEKLNLPYRVIQLAYDDMSFSATKTYDIEVWFPSENRYREISSVSNTLDFQSKRSKIRYKDNLFSKEEKTKYPHILNGSSLAIDRLFAALIDNYQNEDGSISIPELLM